MDFRSQSASLDALASHNADALVLIVAGDSLPASLDKTVTALVKDAIKLGDFDLKTGQVLTLVRPAGLKASRLVIAASGAASLKAARVALGAALGQLKGRGAVSASVAYVGFAAELTESLAEQSVLAALEAVYVYRETKPSAPAAPKLAKLTLLVGKDDAKAVKAGLVRGEAIGAGIGLARECANLPPNVATPAYLAEQTKALVKSHGIKVEVLDQKGIEKLGMGSFLSVAKGSDVPPRFIVAKYEGAARTQAPVVLVGKGITFDSGGISLKPGAGMDEMKFDMGGAASVLGTLRAVVELKPKINLVVLIAACENMPSARAVKPGDVVTSMSGQTIEILNTDAEGRLILCDALTYAERFKPAAVVDVATLTGACVIALGGVRSGMYASDDELAGALSAAGDAALDPCWRMPLDDDYAEGLKTNFADVANVAGREGGSITAAKFLQRFASKYRWGHLDIAGTAWKGGGAKGATGRPVGLLTHFVLSQVR
ncbi:leucyl aminopeptidase [Roseateles aquatilis]|uniref:Probable cytosol aminopeptidase n=1 Tax=Roseateles aquatilis TaxID=431061 RepID=A0A246JHK7_9BURK|nr:leucyl aminopeptidase [Roseateles aquatilis]OWQ92055.1 leucyl aminopeptidase [Roseateles aquatilis]